MATFGGSGCLGGIATVHPKQDRLNEGLLRLYGDLRIHPAYVSLDKSIPDGLCDESGKPLKIPHSSGGIGQDYTDSKKLFFAPFLR